MFQPLYIPAVHTTRDPSNHLIQSQWSHSQSLETILALLFYKPCVFTLVAIKTSIMVEKIRPSDPPLQLLQRRTCGPRLQ